jgi:Domain of unknown function (DUF4406)
MKVVYIAGPYRASGEYQTLQNIRRAEELALRVWRSGAACICPHKNTAFFGGAADDSVWLAGDLEILLRCDAVLCTDNWGASRGATGEVQLARSRGIPVFEAFEEFEKWLAESRGLGDDSGGCSPSRRFMT